MSFENTALLSAYRFNLSEEANRKRHISLRDNLHRRFHGAAIFETSGRYVDEDGRHVAEKLFVVDVPDYDAVRDRCSTLEYLKQQLRAYDQDFLVYTNRSGVAYFISADGEGWIEGSTGVWVASTADATAWTTCRWGNQWTILPVNNC